MKHAARILALSVAAVLGPWAAARGEQPEPARPAGAAEKAKGGSPRVLIMKDLSRRPVRLVALGADQVQVLGQRSTRPRPTSIPRRDVLAILADEASSSSGPGEAVLVTAAGERLIGRLGTEEDGAKPGETVVWQTRRLGDLSFKLEELSVLEFSPPLAEPAAGKAGEDRVLLANGDVLSGFLAGLGSVVRIEVGKDVREVPLSGVARVDLSNPRKPAAGPVVWLTGGEVLRVTRAAGTATETALTRDGKAVTVPTAEVLGFVEDAARLRPLAAVPPASVAPIAPRTWAGQPEVGGTAVPLGAADITLPSPMTVVYDLAEGAVRVGAHVVLPAACRVWGDCVLVVEQAGAKGVPARELARIHLSGDAPEADLNAELLAGGGPLRFTLLEGENGPIQDRVVLRQPLLLFSGR
jgi:hypothetical protein